MKNVIVIRTASRERLSNGKERILKYFLWEHEDIIDKCELNYFLVALNGVWCVTKHRFPPYFRKYAETLTYNLEKLRHIEFNWKIDNIEFIYRDYSNHSQFDSGPHTRFMRD